MWSECARSTTRCPKAFKNGFVSWNEEGDVYMRCYDSRSIHLGMVGLLLLCVLSADNAHAACYPEGASRTCNVGACLGTETCNTHWSECVLSGRSTQSCSVCGRTGTLSCDTDGAFVPGSCSAYAAEVCNGCDDDGDGSVDEGLTAGACDPQGNGCTGTRTCVAGAWTCVIPSDRQLSCGSQCGGTAYKQCNPDGTLGPCTRVTPSVESCNGCDDNRDGVVDNLPGQGPDTLVSSCVGPNGVCPGSTRRCVAGAWSSQCTAPPEQCNGLDDDCDGQFDEDGVCRSDSLTCQCQPWSCAQLGLNCGSVPDGCGGTLACGTCPAGQSCGAGGTANVCGLGNGCAPKPQTTACAGRNCGMASDGCGSEVGCGTCTGYSSCGGGGTPGVCGCTPLTKTAACAGRNCGTVSNGCGGFHDCGTCASPQTCGGGGTANVCGCTPLTQAAACSGKNCGTVSNGCGGTYTCGTCSGFSTCGGGGTANVCGCTPLTKAQACGAAGQTCGSASTGCGGSVSCGTCPSGTFCKNGVCGGNVETLGGPDEQSSQFSR